MNVGDLVKHVPVKGSTAGKLYTDLGHDRDFEAGIIIQAKNDFRQVLPATSSKKPAWYEMSELVVLSKAKGATK